MFKFLLIFLFFLLPGCADHCIKPESLSNLREKLDIVSTKQKWVNSGVNISNKVRVTEIDIVPSKLNFCPNQYKDFTTQDSNIALPFELKKDDKISFSIVGNKICKNNENDEKRYVKINEKCNEKETEYFAKILNREECYKDNEVYVCPNKYTIGNAKWLNGKEYWGSDLSNRDEKKEEIENIINSIKQGQNIDCSKLSDSNKAGKIDTYLLNLACEKICDAAKAENCVQIESNTIENDLTKSLRGFLDQVNNIDPLVPDQSKLKNDGINRIINDALNGQAIKTYIPSLEIKMVKENFEHVQGGIRTNYEYEIESNHDKGEKLTSNLVNSTGKGGYNIRVTKNYSLKDNLYISVSNKFPEHKPGDNSEDIPVDINQVHDFEYMEGIRKKLNIPNKTGTIYYGIRDHGCDYKNEGEFSINVTTKEPPIRTFSAIYDFFDEKVKAAFFGSSYKNADAIHSENSPTKSLYQSFIASNKTGTMRSTIIALLVLYIVLYTLYYFFGLSHLSIYEFLIISVKIGIITQLLKDDSWNFFYNNAFTLFVNAPTQLIGDIANFRGTSTNAFEFLDLPLSRFLSSHSVLLIVSLIFYGPLGIVAFCLVIWGLITVLLSIFNALFSFVTSIAIIALLLSLAPIFIICVLFKYTRQMFQRWVGYLARFAIHPVILLIFMSLISQVMDYIVYAVFDFEVCTKCILRINLKIIDPCIIYGYAPKYAPNIAAMMAFVILGHAMKALVEASSNISDSLFGCFVQGEPGKQYQQSLLGVVGLDKESIQRRKGGGGGAPPSSGTTNQRPQRPPIPQIPGK